MSGNQVSAGSVVGGNGSGSGGGGGDGGGCGGGNNATGILQQQQQTILSQSSTQVLYNSDNTKTATATATEASTTATTTTTATNVASEGIAITTATTTTTNTTTPATTTTTIPTISTTTTTNQNIAESTNNNNNNNNNNTTTTTTNSIANEGGSNITSNVLDTSPRESGDDSEDESEILEESPCGRWLKRREEVDQRDVPGIDCVHLAMDTEEGVEVVWNEVQYGSLQELKSQEEKMRQVFDNLLQLDHQNIVKFHRYWFDTQHSERPRVIFITEYMSSGSLKQFLKRTKRNAKRLPLEAWRRWCTQILSALSYLHSCTPPVIHGNLTCDSIFIQHNGLVKIGSVVPDAVHRQHKADLIDHGAHYFMAPEYGAAEQLTAAVDIYAFGMCALEMAALEIQPNSGVGESSSSASINDETILRTINSLEHDLQRDLIFKCLRRNPIERPSASDLLFHPLLFEVHSLKLLAAHCLVFSPKNRTMFSETVIDGMMQRFNQPDVIMACVQYANGEEKQLRLCDVPSADKLEKFVEDVKFGVYPLTVFSGKKPPHFRSRAASPERIDSVKSATPEPVDIESRRIVNMMCSVKKMHQDSEDIAMTILLRMDDKMNRQLTCQVTATDSAADLTDELVRLGFVHIDDRDKIQTLLEETLHGSFVAGVPTFEYGAQPLTFSATINEHAAAGLSGMSMSKVDVSEFTTTTTTGPNDNDRSWSVAETEPQSQSHKQQQHKHKTTHHHVDNCGSSSSSKTKLPIAAYDNLNLNATSGGGGGGGSAGASGSGSGSGGPASGSSGSSNMQTAVTNSNHSSPSPTSVSVAAAAAVINFDATSLSSAASNSSHN